MTAYRKAIISVTVEFEDKRPGEAKDAATGSIHQFWRNDFDARGILKRILKVLPIAGQEDEPKERIEP